MSSGAHQTMRNGGGTNALLPPVSVGAWMRRHFMPVPFSGSALPQKRHDGAGGLCSAARISLAAFFPASIAKSHRRQQISSRKRDAGVTRASAPHMLHKAYQLPKTLTARPRI